MLKRTILLGLLLALAGAAGAVKEVKTIIHTDHLGSPIMGRSMDGETLWERHYEPYGSQDQDPDDPASPGYTGHLEERDSGMVYAGARWYDPRIGRFMSPDPVGFSVRNPMSFNRYAYANNNPFFYVDPTGERGKAVAWLVDIAGSKMRYVARISKERAILARRQGKNVAADRKQVASQIETAAHGKEDLVRHKGHRLPDGNEGRPHYQTKGKHGHTFWSAIAGVSLYAADALDGVAQAAEYLDPSIFLSGSPPAPKGWEKGWFGYHKIDPDAPDYYEAMRIQYESK